MPRGFIAFASLSIVLASCAAPRPSAAAYNETLAALPTCDPDTEISLNGVAHRSVDGGIVVCRRVMPARAGDHPQPAGDYPQPAPTPPRDDWQ